MILPVQTRVREHLAAVLAQLYGLDAAALPRFPRIPAHPQSSATWALPSRSSWRAGCAGPTRHRGGNRRGLGVSARRAAGGRGPERVSQLLLDRSAFLRERLRAHMPAAAPRRTARRSSSTRPSTRTRPPTSATCATRALGDTLVRGAAVPRHPRRGAELHRRHRRAGGRRRGRLPRARGQVARRDPADRRFDALRLLLLGPLRARHRVVRRATRRGSPSAPRPCTTSSTAATTTPRSPPSSPTASSRCHLRDDGAAERRTTTS